VGGTKGSAGNFCGGTEKLGLTSAEAAGIRRSTTNLQPEAGSRRETPSKRGAIVEGALREIDYKIDGERVLKNCSSRWSIFSGDKAIPSTTEIPQYRAHRRFTI